VTDYRDPKTGKRTAVLRPEDPKKALERLATWNALMDEGLVDASNECWLMMLREQGWRFIGWLQEDTKTTSGGALAAPGDLHMPEERFEKDFRR
jgi:hypothetical protein